MDQYQGISLFAQRYAGVLIARRKVIEKHLDSNLCSAKNVPMCPWHKIKLLSHTPLEIWEMQQTCTDVLMVANLLKDIFSPYDSWHEGISRIPLLSCHVSIALESKVNITSIVACNFECSRQTISQKKTLRMMTFHDPPPAMSCPDSIEKQGKYRTRPSQRANLNAADKTSLHMPPKIKDFPTSCPLPRHQSPWST